MALIDLHLHTTASDGRCSPAELIARAANAGIGVLSVTDHDTRAAHDEARAAAEARGIVFIPGIEITSVYRGKNVHVLAYGLPGAAPELDGFLAQQRASRTTRALGIADKLAALGAPISKEALLEMAHTRTGKALARPQIADLLVQAGHATSVSDAFDRYIGEQCAAYVPHTGASPADVVALVDRLGGVASLAHPGQLASDELIPGLVAQGLHAIEVFHSSHDATATAHYASIAARLGVAMTGGSDYHGEGTRRADAFGTVGLPAEQFERLQLLLARTMRPAH